MRKLVRYYLAILLPLVAIIILINYKILTSFQFVISLLIYVFVYRTFVDGKRLVCKNIIKNNEIWKLIIPGMRFKYFKALYLK